MSGKSSLQEVKIQAYKLAITKRALASVLKKYSDWEIENIPDGPKLEILNMHNSIERRKKFIIDSGFNPDTFPVPVLNPGKDRKPRNGLKGLNRRRAPSGGVGVFNMSGSLRLWE